MRTVQFACLSLLLSCGALAQSPVPGPPASTTPTADQLFERYVEALGGRAKLEKVTSYAVRGTFQVEDVPVIGHIEVLAKAPNKASVTITIPDVGSSREVFDGRSGWAVEPGRGLRQLSGDELANFAVGSDFHSELHPRHDYPQMKVVGNAKVGTRPAYVVEATPERGAPRKLYFDTETGLLLLEEFVNISPRGSELVQSYHEDYRELEGLKYPYRLRQVTPRLTYVIRATAIRFNVPIDDALFLRPSAPEP